MKILLVNTFDRGGAANACIRLHLALLDMGVDSKLLLKRKFKDIPQSYEFKKTTRTKSKLSRLQSRLTRLIDRSWPRTFKSFSKLSSEDQFLLFRDKRLSLFSFPETEFDITESKLYQEADIINLHWVARFVDFQSFFEKNQKPVVWTLHDMNPFTGGEHYQDGILGLTKEDKPILRKVTPQEQEVHRKIIELKSSSLPSDYNIQIVAPSKWLYEESANSQLFHYFQHHHIANGLDLNNFKIISQKFARKLLGLPKNKKILLFLAESTLDKRKGLDFLFSAIKNIEDTELNICAVGVGNDKLEDAGNLHYLGYIGDQRLLNLCYSAADAFVIPSLMDNLPNTVIESLFCGVPVIGFKVGGIIDMIEPEKNGLLANEITSEALRDTIIDFLQDPYRFNRKKIRSNAVNKYSSNLQAAKYIELFSSINKSI
ncbi:glycosyltransferase [Leeuwenhoekiella sp. H156]|uniref:glycosyltransferase n=1 Tax=Leeuwenhoekiella sp. H156 TaxID=3450128 RepID=UPI003FA419E3